MMYRLGDCPYTVPKQENDCSTAFGCRGRLRYLSDNYETAAKKELPDSPLSMTVHDMPLPGDVVQADAQGVRVACGQGQLCLTQLQRPGGKRLSAADFLHGCPLQVGQRLVMA